MFVLQNTYDKLYKKCKTLEESVKNGDLLFGLAVERCAEWRGKYENLLQTTASKASPVTFTQDELKSLLSLVHPDKHQGKPSAVIMTQKILELRTR
jgi:hypothetical protein